MCKSTRAQKRIRNKMLNVMQLPKSLRSRDIQRGLGVGEETQKRLRSAPAVDVDGLITKFGKASQREA